MKSIRQFVLAAVFSAALSFTAIAQEIPTGSYVAHPTPDGIGVVWNDTNYLSVEFGTNIVMSFAVDGGENYVWDQSGKVTGTRVFADPSKWLKFASNVLADFYLSPTGDWYVEKTPWVFMGKSVLVEHGETPDSRRALVFARSSDYKSIPLPEWMGPIPKKLEAVTIGQTDSGDLYFFPATATLDGRFMPSDALLKQLEKDRKEVAGEK